MLKLRCGLPPQWRVGPTLYIGGKVQVTVIAVPVKAQTNLALGIDQGVWGFTKVGKDAAQIAPGTPILLGTNYRNDASGKRDPRISKKSYHEGMLETLILGRATGAVRSVPNAVLWPDEIKANSVKYRERFPLSSLGQAQNLDYKRFAKELSNAFHDSINAVGSPVTVDLPIEVLNQLAQAAGLDKWPLTEEQFPLVRGGVDPEELGTILDRQTGKGTKPRYEQDPKVRKAVEVRAVEVAMCHYRSLGWDVEELGKPYDIHCSRSDGSYLRVEVKGTRGLGAQVELTINEVESALAHPSELFIVRNIRVENAHGQPVGKGGDIRILTDWTPEGYKPIRFTYEVPWELAEQATLDASA